MYLSNELFRCVSNKLKAIVKKAHLLGGEPRGSDAQSFRDETR